MRNGQNKQRMRNRNNNNNNNNRRGQNPMTRVYESNGPDIKIRGTASHIAEKYLQLARDARSSGDPVAAENYYQHAEHYFRLIAAAQEQFRQNQQPRGDEPISNTSGDDSEDDGENFSAFGQEPGFVPQPPQQQPFMRDRDGQRDHHQRDHQQRDNQQPYQRDNQQPREHRERDHRPQPQYQPQPQPANQPQPVIADAGSVDRLPSFITGAQPQVNGAQGGFEGGGGGGERFPRRRRRPHGPRPDREAAPAASSDEVASGE
ncbi:hypothetical protein ACVIW2_006066 [Bradyrhizobium huanghuaihaiense]|uniref:Uncharacterized protein DUF4167 n=1 Tax=Bradyrhizobium huanghuaihaiense TaxID=990078 RepID=A0A562RNG8_9BRAD|nr:MULTISPECIES: DUF4167 domain-containing protein [Bradyrhizobium]TWI70582.1 uncharacterized protein DUF4167 [Bradyrhizobium huanghuaihaiense]UWU77410.1 DUF4167 domain-containing protein [Bradyrhizobium sp. CB3035]WFU25286.1 DUF4167 domain-containing protein [Bradyrhizobium sp. CB1717]